MSDVDITIVVGVVLVVGLCGVVLPLLPGLVLMFGAIVLYGFAVGWSSGGVAVAALAGGAVLLSLVLSVVLPRRSAAEGGASGLAQLGGLVGAVVGFFVIPVVGVIVGALIGVFGVELARRGNRASAWQATLATAKGFGVSALIDLGLGLAVLTAWALWATTVVL